MEYIYTAQTKEGWMKTGVLKASSLEEAKEFLEKRGLKVFWLKERRSVTPVFSFLKRVSVGEKAVFMRQLSTMLKAGFPIDKALYVIETETKNDFFREVLAGIRKQVEGGESLATALSSYPRVFEPVIVAVIKAGESAGHLPQVTEILAKGLEREASFHASLWGALLYPLFVVVAMIVVGAVLLMNFIPRISSLFAQANTPLPWQTRVVVAVGNFLQHYWWAVFLFVAVVGGYFYWYITSSKEGRKAFEYWLLRLPVIKELALRSQMARLNHLFYLLFRAGTPILEAIDLVKDSLDFELFKEALERVREKVEKGLPFSSSLAEEDIFPTLESQLISVGEQTGALEKMFKRLAEYYRERTKEYIQKVTSLLEPVVIVVLAVGVAILVWAVFGPLYSLVQLGGG
ncbi:type II secretion system F family protein [bacterium]|nr:type II secretion system F family protein [bacterium]